MAHSNLRSDVVIGSPPSEEGHPFGSNPPDIVEILSDDLLSDVSQISDQCEPVCKRKKITSYKYGTSDTSSCSEYESSNVSDRDKRKNTNQRKRTENS